MSFSINDTLEFGIKELGERERPRLEAELLLAHMLGVERVYLHAHSNQVLKEDEFGCFKSFIEQVKNHVPIEYLTQKVGFYGYEWNICRGVLIPRPETEILIDQASALIQTKGLKKVFEFGVGSGVIGITLALIHQDIEIVGSDINPLALRLSQKNLNFFSQKYDATLKNRVRFMRQNVLEDATVVHQNSFDLLVSNPPYIARDYLLPLNVQHEPKEALFGGVGGEEILCALVDLAKKGSIPYVACEMGYDQRNKMQIKLRNAMYSEFFQDLNGLDRGFVASLR